MTREGLYLLTAGILIGGMLTVFSGLVGKVANKPSDDIKPAIKPAPPNGQPNPAVPGKPKWFYPPDANAPYGRTGAGVPIA